MEKQSAQFIEVEGPDGRVFEFPTGMAEVEISAVMAKHYGGDTPWYEDAARFVDDTVRSAARGATFGFADEIAAGLNTGFGLLGDYDKAVVEERARDDRFREDSPVTSTVAEVAGGIGSTLAVPWLKAATTPAQGASLAARTATGVKSGAGLGALYGAGNADGDLSDRAIGALQAGTVGAATGGLAVPAVDLGAKGVRLIADQTLGRLPSRQAQVAANKVAEALQRDGLTPDQAMQRIRQLGPEAALLDAGPNSQALARAVYTQPGKGKPIIGDFLRTRQEGTRNPATGMLQGGQNSRVTASIEKLVPDTAKDARGAVANSKTLSGQSYNAARAGDDLVDVLPVISSLDDEITKSKGGIKSALSRVRSFLVDDAGRPEVTIDTLHQAKMAIDDLMSGEARSSMGNVAKARIRAYQDALVEAIESAGEAGAKYREGRLGTAAAWRINDALDMGEGFMLKRVAATPDDLADQLAKMRPEELEAFRTGAAQAIKSKLGDMNTRTDVTKRLMDIPNLEQKIRLAFGDDQTFKRYIDALEAERTMFDAYGRIISGSRTGEVLAEQADAGKDVGRVAQGVREIFLPQSMADPVRGITNIAGGLKDRAAIPGPVSGRLAKLLTGRSVDPLTEAMKSQVANDTFRRNLAQRLTVGGTALSAPNVR